LILNFLFYYQFYWNW